MRETPVDLARLQALLDRSYDAAGNLTRQTDARGQTIAFTYDDLGRMAGKDYGADGSFDVSYSYDAGPHGLGYGRR